MDGDSHQKLKIWKKNDENCKKREVLKLMVMLVLFLNYPVIIVIQVDR